MVPMHGQNDLEAFHEPPRPSNRSLLWESGAKDARTPDATRLPGVSEPREASGVRPIYRRFQFCAERPSVNGPRQTPSGGGFTFPLREISTTPFHDAVHKHENDIHSAG